jgi:hypothetical protein
MPKQPMCADNLFLLGELLQGAREYVTRSRQNAEDEDAFMIELARDQIPQLRLALRNLEHSLADLDGHLKQRLEVDFNSLEPEKKSERKSRKASSGG